MSYYRDIREYLDGLAHIGKLRTISTPINKDTELHPLVRWQFRGLKEEERFVFLFEQLIDRDGVEYPCRVVSSVIAPSARSMSVHVTVQVVSVPLHIAATITRHSLDQFRDLSSDAVRFPYFTRKKGRREGCWPWTPGYRRKTMVPQIRQGAKRLNHVSVTHIQRDQGLCMVGGYIRPFQEKKDSSNAEKVPNQSKYL